MAIKFTPPCPLCKKKNIAVREKKLKDFFTDEPITYYYVICKECGCRTKYSATAHSAMIHWIAGIGTQPINWASNNWRKIHHMPKLRNRYETYWRLHYRAQEEDLKFYEEHQKDFYNIQSEGENI